MKIDMLRMSEVCVALAGAALAILIGASAARAASGGQPLRSGSWILASGGCGLALLSLAIAGAAGRWDRLQHRILGDARPVAPRDRWLSLIAALLLLLGGSVQGAMFHASLPDEPPASRAAR